MVLKITDTPKFVEKPIRIDPYETVMKLIKLKKYDKIKEILIGNTHARQISVFPTILLHMSAKDYFGLISHAKKQEYAPELYKCFKLAKSIARQFHSTYDESNLEKAIKKLENSTNPTTRIKEFPYASFKRMYGIYRYEA